METNLNAMETIAASLGERTIPSPLEQSMLEANPHHSFYSDDERVLVENKLPQVKAVIDAGGEFPCFEVAGPRRKLFFDPAKMNCGIVTCGGLCPGLNDVIRALVIHSHYRYRVKRIYGFRYGFEGLNPDYGHEPVELTPEVVTNIDRFGGTWLGTSRGPQDIGKMVDRLQELDIQALFILGGDGSQKGANQINKEAQRRGYALSVVGIPKTIDNDMIYMDKSFGFETACASAVEIIHSAHTEAVSSRNGVGLVKLMGRHSGFIACAASIASGEVNCALIPEIPFSIDGEKGFLAFLRNRIASRGHAVIVVAEGAGQNHLQATGERDASGNIRLKDIGIHLRDRITEDFQQHQMDLNLKYIDPSYIIRSVPATTQDRIYCQRLAQAAVHAAMAGKTGIIVARWHGAYVHVPIEIVTSCPRTVDTRKDIWFSVLESTGQPPSLL